MRSSSQAATSFPQPSCGLPELSIYSVHVIGPLAGHGTVCPDPLRDSGQCVASHGMASKRDGGSSNGVSAAARWLRALLLVLYATMMPSENSGAFFTSRAETEALLITPPMLLIVSTVLRPCSFLCGRHVTSSPSAHGHLPEQRCYAAHAASGVVRWVWRAMVAQTHAEWDSMPQRSTTAPVGTSSRNLRHKERIRSHTFSSG